MFKKFCCVCLLAASTLASVQAQSVAAKPPQAAAAETAIRAARAELNTALAKRDMKATAKYWHAEVNTTGADGIVWAGKAKNVAGFTSLFKGSDFVSGSRTPEKIEVATPGLDGAAESGVWEWRERAKDQVLVYTGRYLIMWELVKGEWQIRSELYVSTACTGGTGCQ